MVKTLLVAAMVCFLAFRDVTLPEISLAINCAMNGLPYIKIFRAQFEISNPSILIHQNLTALTTDLNGTAYIKNQIEFELFKTKISQRIRRLMFVVNIAKRKLPRRDGLFEKSKPAAWQRVARPRQIGKDKSYYTSGTIMPVHRHAYGRANVTTDEVVSMDRISADSSTRLLKVMLARDKYPEAVCNDGSPAAFYHQVGLPEARDWIVHLEVRCAQSGC
jgi:hypothetical protein